MRGLFNYIWLEVVGGVLMFQSALRMRGLFNRDGAPAQDQADAVSIRLADAWPFQPVMAASAPAPGASFNPPCGCVAFSTISQPPVAAGSFQFQSALRMRGLFNPVPGTPQE